MHDARTSQVTQTLHEVNGRSANALRREAAEPVLLELGVEVASEHLKGDAEVIAEDKMIVHVNHVVLI